MSWIRARFYANLEDSRPIKWPPVGPFWETGFNDTHSIVVAYVKTKKQIKEFWPEAVKIEAEKCDEITFTSRFRKPKWWKPDATEKGEGV